MSVAPLQRACELVNQLVKGNPRQVRLATILSGLLGIPDSVPWLIEMMKRPEYARVAGESFSRITGLRLDQRPFEGEWPDGFEAGPSEDPEDENVEMDQDENLPFPDPDAVSAWWNEHSCHFESNVRYLLGWEIANPAWLRKILIARTAARTGNGRIGTGTARSARTVVRNPGERQSPDQTTWCRTASDRRVPMLCTGGRTRPRRGLITVHNVSSPSDSRLSRSPTTIVLTRESPGKSDPRGGDAKSTNGQPSKNRGHPGNLPDALGGIPVPVVAVATCLELSRLHVHRPQAARRAYRRTIWTGCCWPGKRRSQFSKSD